MFLALTLHYNYICRGKKLFEDYMIFSCKANILKEINKK